MHVKEFLENVCNEIKYKPIRNDISEELALHIEEVKQDYIAEGLTEENAEEKAVSNMGNAEEIGKKLNKIHRPKLDWMLLILVAILIGFGILVIFIRTSRETDSYSINRGIKFIAIGIIASCIVYFMDYRKSLKYSNSFYIVASLLFILTIFSGHSINGSHKYLYLPGIEFSPNYICTYLYIIAFAGFLNKFDYEKNIVININKFCLKIKRDIVKIFLLAIFSLFLSLLVNGVPLTVLIAISYVISTTFQIIKSGKNVKRNLIILYSVITIIFICFSIFVIIARHKVYSRLVESSINNNPEYNFTHRYNGWYGVKINEVLENANFTSGLEENMDVSYFGLFDGGTCHALITIVAYCGSLYLWIIVSTIILLFVKLIMNCKKINDSYGKLLIVGFSSIILLQSLVNILGNLNLIPLMDINLPFISYGFNGLLVNMLTIAFLLSIYRRKDILFKEVDKNKKLKLKIYFE